MTRGSWVKAEQAFRWAVDLRCDRLGAEAGLTLEARSRLAVALIGLSRREEAEAELRDLVVCCPAVLGEDHGLTSDVRIDLANLLVRKNRLDDAMELALAVLRCRPAPDEFGLMAWGTKLRVYAAQGRHREAADEAQTLREQNAQVYGENHIRTLKAGADRVQNLVFLGEYETAERECRALIDQHGKQDQLWLAVMNALILALNGLGRHDQAETAARKALKQEARITKPGGDWRVVLGLGLARSLSGRGHHEEALRVASQATAEALRSPGVRVSLMAPIATVTARALLGLERLEDAEAEARRAVELAEPNLSPIHHSFLEAATTLGSVLAAQNRRAEAEEQLTRCATAWREHFGPHHPRTVAIEAELATLRS
ncbi:MULTISPECIES: tetratricopeptide repeat protein [Kitasatospora]